VADQSFDAVVFDLGGVLLDWNPRHLYRKLISDPAQMEDFLGRICTPQWHLAHDRGASIEPSCRELASEYPEHADLIMAWAHRGEEMIAGQHDDAISVLAEVSASGTRCLALSNMEAETFPVRRARYPFFGLFDGCVISGVERVAKPDRRIFEILLSRYDLRPEATVFIDDTGANVAAASELGIRAIHYAGASQLRENLRDAGLALTLGTA
jgi:2-haloacid dehalogenase